MDSIVVISENCAPLLSSVSRPASNNSDGGDALAVDGEILPEHDSAPLPAPATFIAHPVKPNAPNQRLASLDVFRGLTVALMILVDDAGGAVPAINHSPWFGVTLADFVMPFFLFGVGVSIALACGKASNKLAATRKIIIRTFKLFSLGVLMQGGYFHGRNHWTYGVDIDHIRWLGVLQRISIGYFLGAISEVWLARNVPVDSPMSFMKKYYVQWIVAILLSAMYVALLLGLYVPNWEFEVLSSNSTVSTANYGLQFKTVHCGYRGNLSPPCNAVGFVDRQILGGKHLYHNPVYKRTKECSINSPDYGPLPPNSPEWCLAPFDPEGILSSVMAAVTCFTGIQVGHVIMHIKSHVKRILFWVVSSLVFLLFACVLVVLGMPLSKPLYTLSYMFLTAGASGLALSFIYYLVDVKHIRKPSLLLQWMGMNALLVYVLAACELFPAALQGFYWRSPSNNLVNLTESYLQSLLRSERWGTLAFVLLQILFWCLVSGFLHLKGIYFKL
ncbi:hypothetical protein KSP40_PGU006401 [Platanthera guangdongensis]|uniref:Heparan-alpha-glucosaminide N-acetyltransferase catalytic domain-containing protein n=1 Tax=Platanthera guangdongensis TaxID=2320717 RepID=A0ABR2MTV2_9ASPA